MVIDAGCAAGDGSFLHATIITAQSMLIPGKRRPRLSVFLMNGTRLTYVSYSEQLPYTTSAARCSASAD